MTQPKRDPETPFAPIDAEAQRRKIIAGRNNALALVLVGFVVLFFAITIVKMKWPSHMHHAASTAQTSAIQAAKP